MKLKHQIKLICTDLDSTLIPADGNKVSAKNHAALQAAKALGIKLAIVTARNFSRCIHIAREIKADYLISTSGSAIYDLKKAQFIFQKYIQETTLTQVLEVVGSYPEVFGCFYSSQPDPSQIAVYTMNGTSKDWSQEAVSAEMPLINLDKNQPLPHFACLHILLEGQLPHLLQIQKQLQKVSGLEVICCNYNRFMEINPIQVNKASSIQWLSEQIGIDPHNEVMAFGDGPNDISLIKMTQYGIAVANATSALKAEAFYVTGRQEDDGVAQAISHWLLP